MPCKSPTGIHHPAGPPPATLRPPRTQTGERAARRGECGATPAVAGPCTPRARPADFLGANTLAFRPLQCRGLRPKNRQMIPQMVCEHPPPGSQSVVLQARGSVCDSDGRWIFPPWRGAGGGQSSKYPHGVRREIHTNCGHRKMKFPQQLFLLLTTVYFTICSNFYAR